nr:MAG TPA: hypothetical protein [Caudoviricetes sp.]
MNRPGIPRVEISFGRFCTPTSSNLVMRCLMPTSPYSANFSCNLAFSASGKSD